MWMVELSDIYLEARAAANNVFLHSQCVFLCLGPLIYKEDAKTGDLSQ